MLIGDWNCNSDQFLGTVLGSKLRWQVLAPDASMINGNTVDFALVHSNLALRSMTTEWAVPWRPHCLLTYALALDDESIDNFELSQHPCSSSSRTGDDSHYANPTTHAHGGYVGKESTNRTTTLTSVLYRAWCRLRKEHLDAWQTNLPKRLPLHASEAADSAKSSLSNNARHLTKKDCTDGGNTAAATSVMYARLGVHQGIALEVITARLRGHQARKQRGGRWAAQQGCNRLPP